MPEEKIFEKEFLTIADVQSYLNLSKSAAYSLVHRKDFPIAHFGGAIRVPASAFKLWVAQNTYVPKALCVYEVA